MERMESSSLKVYLLKERSCAHVTGNKGSVMLNSGGTAKDLFVPRIGMKRSFYMKTRGRIMLDIKMIRQNFDKVQTKLQTRGVKKY